MGRSFLVALALAGLGGGEPPDGKLVLGVHGHGEWAAVADPLTGEMHRRRLAGGTLCRGPVLAVGDRVVFSSYRGNRAVVRSLPLSLSGPARVVGPGEVFAPAPGEPSLWLGRWIQHDPTVLSLREVRTDGDVLVRTRALLPRMGVLHAALARSFVMTSGRWLILWDVFRDVPIRIARDAQFVASHLWRFAWCRGGCRELRVWRPGGDRTLALPAGARWLGTSGRSRPTESGWPWGFGSVDVSDRPSWTCAPGAGRWWRGSCAATGRWRGLPQGAGSTSPRAIASCAPGRSARPRRSRCRSRPAAP